MSELATAAIAGVATLSRQSVLAVRTASNAAATSGRPTTAAWRSGSAAVSACDRVLIALEGGAVPGQDVVVEGRFLVLDGP